MFLGLRKKEDGTSAQVSPGRPLPREQHSPVWLNPSGFGVSVMMGNSVFGCDSATEEFLSSSGDPQCLWEALRDSWLSTVSEVSCIDPSESRFRLLQMSLLPWRGEVKLRCDKSLAPFSNTSSAGSSSSQNRLLATATGLERLGKPSPPNPEPSAVLNSWMVEKVPVSPVWELPVSAGSS